MTCSTEIKTTKDLSDEQWEHYAQERGYLDAERERWEEMEMRSIMEAEDKLAAKHAKVLLGKARKRDKFTGYATVTTIKKPRFIKHLQHK